MRGQRELIVSPRRSRAHVDEDRNHVREKGKCLPTPSRRRRIVDRLRLVTILRDLDIQVVLRRHGESHRRCALFVAVDRYLSARRFADDRDVVGMAFKQRRA